jgi:hypothetical protein
VDRLYNDSDVDINLSGYLLEDGNSSQTDDLILNGIIISKGFMVFNHTEGWLNNGGDTIKLYNNASPSAIIDQYTYGNVDSSKSVARIPNGSENWEITSSITNNSLNPTPSPSPSPSPTQIPTQEPTFTPTNTPTTTPTVTSTPKSTPTKTPTIKPTSTPTETTEETFTNMPTLISQNSNSSTPEGMVAGASTTLKPPIIAIFLIAAGLLLLAIGGVNLYKKMKTEYNSSNENT